LGGPLSRSGGLPLVCRAQPRWPGLARCLSLLLLVGCSLSKVGLQSVVRQAERRGWEERVLDQGAGTGDGLHLRYFVGGEGKPMLVLHGFGGDGISTWRPQLQALSGERRVLLPDLLWFGGSRSERPPCIEEQARALLALLDHEGVTELDAMGVSYGGFVLFALEAARPGLLDRVILVDSPGPAFTEGDLAALPARFGRTSVEEIFLVDSPEGVAGLLSLTFADPPYVPRFLLRDMQENIFSVYREEQRALLRDLPTHREAMGSLDPRPWESPLLIWGEADQVFPVDSGARLAERLAGRLVVIPDTAHGPPAEAPRDFNRILIEELRRP
jgi:pimeloyl-ACP methyl ester carboxylesterase